MRISISKTVLFVALVLLSISLTLCNSVYINYSTRLTVEFLAIVTSLIYLTRFARISTIVKKEALLVAVALFVFAGCIVCFSHSNAGLIIKSDPTITAFLDAGVLCSYFLLISKTIPIAHFTFVKKSIVLILGSFIAINDILLFFFADMAEYFGGEWWTSFFLGTKFDVGYMHLFFIATLFSAFFQKQTEKLKKYIVFIFLIGLTVYSTILVDCNTGIVSTIIFLIFMLMVRKKYSLFVKPQVFSIILLSTLLFVIIYSVILDSSIVKFLVQQVFGRDMSLTGRTNIYKMIVNIFENNIWTGYGYGINYNVSKALFDYDNTQNGLMEWVLQVGIIGTGFLIIFLYSIFFRISKAKPSEGIIPILSFIYVLTIIAMIEISLDLFYFMAIGLLYGMALDEEEERGRMVEYG